MTVNPAPLLIQPQRAPRRPLTREKFDQLIAPHAGDPKASVDDSCWVGLAIAPQLGIHDHDG